MLQVGVLLMEVLTKLPRKHHYDSRNWLLILTVRLEDIVHLSMLELTQPQAIPVVQLS